MSTIPSIDFTGLSNAVSAIDKVGGWVRNVSNIPPDTRQKYRDVIRENCRLLDTTLIMVIIRLGDILQKNDLKEFVQEIKALDNWEEWFKAEKAFRLCDTLRAAYRETRDLRNRIPGNLSVND